METAVLIGILIVLTIYVSLHVHLIYTEHKKTNLIKELSSWVKDKEIFIQDSISEPKELSRIYMKSEDVLTVSTYDLPLLNKYYVDTGEFNIKNKEIEYIQHIQKGYTKIVLNNDVVLVSGEFDSDGNLKFGSFNYSDKNYSMKLYIRRENDGYVIKR